MKGKNMKDKINIDLNLLAVETAQEYHARSAEYLTSHQVIDFMRCPLLHRKKSLGLIEDVELPSRVIGRAAHCRILEGRDVYQESFAFGGPINPTTGKEFGSNTKAFKEWADGQGKPVLSNEQAELVENLAAGVAMNDIAIDLLMYGRAEGVVRAEYCGVACQIRIDWVHPHHGIVDLKTCDDLTWFEADARRYGYIHQLAFYRSVFASASKEFVPCHIVAVEKKEPFRCGVWKLSDCALSSATIENESAIRRMIECRRNNHWPTGYEELRVFEFA